MKYKNIVCFGQDNSGKTTVCNQIAHLIGGTAIHSPGPVSTERMKEFMESNLSAPGIKVFDRFPILEEYVYGNILRGFSRFTDEEYCKQILDKVDLFIYVYPGLFSIINWGDREQMEGVKEKSLELINKFNELAVMLKEKGYNVKEYNYHVGNFKELVTN